MTLTRRSLLASLAALLAPPVPLLPGPTARWVRRPEPLPCGAWCFDWVEVGL